MSFVKKKLEAKEAADFARCRIETFVMEMYTHMSEKNQTLNEIKAEKKLTDPNVRINRHEFLKLNVRSLDVNPNPAHQLCLWVSQRRPPVQAR